METILKMADETVSRIYKTNNVNEYIIYENSLESEDYFIPTIISIFKGNLEIEIINYDKEKALIAFNDRYFIITMNQNDGKINISIDIYDNYLEARRFYRWF